MAAASSHDQVVRRRRLGRAAAWISAACCLPYIVLKVLWTAGVPVGLDDRSLLDSSGWVAGNALMAVLQLAALVLVLALTRPWARRVPTWLVLVPMWVGIGLLFEVVVGAVLIGVFSASSQASSESVDLGGIQPWVFAMVYSSFAGQGTALAIAFACHVRDRWGRLLGAPTSEILASAPTTARSWPDEHLVGIAETVAGMAVAVALVCGYWAAGGSLGASGTQPDSTWALHASGAAGAVVAVTGLLGLAGRWGRQSPFWVPVALTWVGSGAMAAFDALRIPLFLVLRPDASDTGWGATDTIVAVKVAIGVSAGVALALAVAAAAREDHRRRAHGCLSIEGGHDDDDRECEVGAADDPDAGRVHPSTR